VAAPRSEFVVIAGSDLLLSKCRHASEWSDPMNSNQHILDLVTDAYILPSRNTILDMNPPSVVGILVSNTSSVKRWQSIDITVGVCHRLSNGIRLGRPSDTAEKH
jgi:hypothetical protein